MRRHDRAPSDRAGHDGAVIATDDVQAQVEAGGDAGARQHRTLVDIQDGGIDRDSRIPARQLVGGGPVCGGASPVQHAGLGEDECAGADGHHPDPVRVGLGDGGCRGRDRVRVAVKRDAGYDDGVGARERLHAKRRHDVKAGRGPDGAGLHPGERQRVMGGAAVAEQVGRRGEVEQHHAVEGEGHDAVGLGRGARRGWHELDDTWRFCHLWDRGGRSTMVR